METGKKIVLSILGHAGAKIRLPFEEEWPEEDEEADKLLSKFWEGETTNNTIGALMCGCFVIGSTQEWDVEQDKKISNRAPSNVGKEVGC